MDNYKLQHMEIDLDKPICEKNVGLVMGSGDENANTFTVSVKRGGKMVDLSGCTVTGYLIMPNDETLRITGSVKDGKASVTVPKSGYVYDGSFQLAIKTVVSGKENTVAIFVGQNARTTTENISDGEKLIYGVKDILNMIDSMEQAETDAKAAATSANNAAASANGAASKANTATSNANAATTAANNAAQAATTAAGNANTATTNANNAAGAANQAAGRAETVASKSPYIGDNGNWYVYDVEKGAFVDSGLPSRGIPGQGAVSTVNGKQPDAKGDVSIDAADVGAFVVEDGAGSHNAIYRGKNLGTAVTAGQYAAIANGTFRDLFVGDYWIINNVTYRIAAFDYYYNTGDTACTTHHVTLVPDSVMYNHYMNDTRTTAGGYVGSKMYTEGLEQAKTTINTAFGSAHVLTHRQYLCNAVTNGKPSGASWYDSTVELMTEQNCYGGKVFGAGNDCSTIPILYTVDKSQFPLFAFRPDMISNRNWFWLRDVASDAYFAYVSTGGYASYVNASKVDGVRPAFSVVG